MTGFARQPNQAPQFDAKALAKFLKLTDAQRAQLVTWKRWVEASNEHDATGLRDVVKANALALDALKSDFDSFRTLTSGQITQLFERVTALETRPQSPFPGSS